MSFAPTSYDTELIHEFVNERIRSGRGWIAAYFVHNLEKILGILLLVILGLLFLCLLAVLFVPIRYRGNGSYHSIKDFCVHLHIHWLIHACVAADCFMKMGFDMRLSCLDSGFSG